ncbi:polysaccharide deacetylase family protein [Neobacillus drentensis]|uniref:polysaccharide deacetylase family protein n=1 Tax=Neobacillus drentensis TaxID=220684 RepID=UPI002FFE2D83
MNPDVTIVMYHYVRDYQNTKYPDIKGMDVRTFEKQVQYLKNNYNVISMDELVDAIQNGASIDEHSAVLTFDDAYSDHYLYVYPILKKYGVKGAFYVPTGILQDKKVLDVNKIHYILASASHETILQELMLLLDRYRDMYNLETIENYFEKYAHANRWDPEEIIFIKRMLQKGLDQEVRMKITDELFQKFVGQPEEEFSKELYLSTEQILEMQNNGMHFGPHTHDHVWLDSLMKEVQKDQMKKSLHYLKEIGVNLDRWTMCYPYGGYNEDTLTLMEEMGCSAAVTVEPKKFRLNDVNKFELPRLDCNDIEW